jgi:site-specific DNA recombinase
MVQKEQMRPVRWVLHPPPRSPAVARKVNMTISLAFLAPDLVKAAIEGRLPRGMGVVRLADLPAEWSRQHQMLGLPSP